VPPRPSLPLLEKRVIPPSQSHPPDALIGKRVSRTLLWTLRTPVNQIFQRTIFHNSGGGGYCPRVQRGSRKASTDIVPVLSSVSSLPETGYWSTCPIVFNFSFLRRRKLKRALIRPGSECRGQAFCQVAANLCSQTISCCGSYLFAGF